MFRISQRTLPPDAASLRAALEEGLRRVVTPAGEMVSIEDSSYPKLAALEISLDHAAVTDRPPLLTPVDPIEPALQVERLEISGAPLRVQGAAINLRCRARQVTIGQSRDRNDDLLLLLQRVGEGAVEISASVADLEELVRTGAKIAASQQGVTIEDVRIELSSRGSRDLNVVVHVRAKKLFLSATVRISGSAEIDEQLTARLSGLVCTGEGALGSLACGFLSPHLQRFDRREFPLMALPLGEVKLHDVRVAGGEELRVTARFGA